MRLILQDVWSEICARHREDSLSYLTVKTAGVRCGIKPGELLRVPGCLKGLKGFCAAFRENLSRLNLPYHLLSGDESGVLALFYDPRCLDATLAREDVRHFLAALGYPTEAGREAMLRELAARWKRNGSAHEVGVFIGYPVADVAGFMAAQRSTASPGDRWRVFGDGDHSRRLMRRYRRVELFAAGVCRQEPDLRKRFERIEQIYNRKLKKGA